MSNNAQSLRLTINYEDHADPEKMFDQTATLKEEIKELEIISVAMPKESHAPAGAKAVDPVTIGAFIVTLAASGGVLTTLINALSSWITRNNARSIVLEMDGDKLEIKGLSSKVHRELIQVWIKRHSHKK